MAKRSTRKTSEIVLGMRELVAHAEGHKAGVRTTAVKIPDIDVKALRDHLGMSQTEFASRFGFARASVCNWEQGKRRPDASARLLLSVIEDHPETVISTIERLDAGTRTAIKQLPRVRKTEATTVVETRSKPTTAKGVARKVTPRKVVQHTIKRRRAG